MAVLPHVLLVDDEDGQLRQLRSELERSGRVTVDTALPSEITLEAVRKAHLVLLDQELKLDEQPQRFPHWVPDGVALANVLRRHVARLGNDGRPVGFALISNELEKLAAPLPVPYQKSQLARQTNLEWVFSKIDESRFVQIPSLAEAIATIPRSWANGVQGLREIGPLLGVAGAPDADECWEVIEASHPPTYEITAWTHGLAFVRWFVVSILSYPCFLWDMRRVAARFRVSVSDFRTAMTECRSLQDFFASAVYTGILNDFDGPRWWGHRIERLAWESTNGDSQSSEALQKVVRDAAGRLVAPSEASLPVLCHDEKFQPIDRAFEFKEAVRIQLDGWPPYAEPAWLPVHVLELNPQLRSLVVPADADRVP